MTAWGLHYSLSRVTKLKVRAVNFSTVSALKPLREYKRLLLKTLTVNISVRLPLSLGTSSWGPKLKIKYSSFDSFGSEAAS